MCQNGETFDLRKIVFLVVVVHYNSCLFNILDMEGMMIGGQQPAFNMYHTMSIASPGMATLMDQKHIPKPMETRDLNNTKDIDGSYAIDKFAKFETKPQFLAERDFPESLPKARTHSRNVPDRSLMVEDIDGAQFTLGGGMDRTNRFVDPLNPKYKLPSYHVAAGLFEAANTKPPRDIMQVKDVNNQREPRFRPTRDPLALNDIDGAKADYNGYDSVRERFEEKLKMAAKTAGKEYTRGAGQNQEAAFNPCNERFQDRTTRCVDPTAPVYTVNGIVIEDDPVRSKPKRLPKLIENGTFSLRTDDVIGATTLSNPKRKERREVRNIMNTADVEGAQADTVQHSIISNRLTCPLFPVYQSLDDGAPNEAHIKPLMPAESIDFPSTRIMKLRQSMGLGPVGASSTGTMQRSASNSGIVSPVRLSARSPATSAPNSARMRASGAAMMSNNASVPNLDFGGLGSARLSARGGSKPNSKGASARDTEIQSVRDLPQ
jgi:hypothetical protein